LKQEGFPSLEENKETWHLGCAGANKQRDMWKQIARAVTSNQPLPFEGTEQAVLGTKR
jgi:hypothetical protein